jgi:hypothetical protein
MKYWITVAVCLILIGATYGFLKRSKQSLEHSANSEDESKTGWKFISPEMMTLREYPCGIRAGDIISLREDLHCYDSNQQPTGEIRPSGDQAMILTGNPDEPNVVWIRWRDGERQTWDEDILESFEIVGKID